MESDLAVDWPTLLAAKLIACGIIVLVALAVSRLLQIPLKRVLKASDGRRGAGTIVQNIIRVAVWGWALCAILDICFGIDVAAIIGALGVVGIAVSLGAQQTIANVIGGLIVELSGMIGPGDWISVDGRTEGCVIDTSWRRTTLKDEENVLYAIPNSLMVSSILEKGHEYYMIVIPFSLKVTTPDVEGLLVECEQVLLDRMVAMGMDYEQMRPKAHVIGASLGAIQAEVKIYPNRTYDSRHVRRAVAPALIELLQERSALADLTVTQVEQA